MSFQILNMKRFFRFFRGSFVILLIIFAFSPFSIKELDSFIPQNNNNLLSFNESAYVEGLARLHGLYEAAIENFDHHMSGEPSAMIMNQIRQQLQVEQSKNSSLSFHQHRYNISIDFQIAVQYLAREINRYSPVKKYETLDFKTHVLQALQRTAHSLYKNPKIKEEEKIAFRMIQLDQLMLHDIYMKLTALDREHIYAARDKEIAIVQAQKKMPQNMISALWHTAAILGSVKKNKPENEPETIEVSSIVYDIHRQHLTPHATAFFE